MIITDESASYHYHLFIKEKSASKQNLQDFCVSLTSGMQGTKL